jgi:di/tricarboxylate transporter
MNIIVDSSLHMTFVLALTALSSVLFVREKWPLEVTSIAILTLLIAFGQFFPLPDANGLNQIDASALLAGFSNSSLIAVLALLVMGQGVIVTDALRIFTNLFSARSKFWAWVSIISVLTFVLCVSAFMNNTPLVIIAIPLLQVLAHTAGLSESRMMMPLSYAAILGGMTTVIGSSTNLLVSSTMMELGYDPLGFFDFFVPGAILAGVGFIYVGFILPYLLTDRSSMAQDLMSGDEKEFVAELDIEEGSKLIGIECHEGKFKDLYDLSVRLIQRSGHLILPPFEGYSIQAGDNLIVAATRQALTDVLSKHPGFLLSQEEEDLIQKQKEELESKDGPTEETKSAETRVLAEIMITPASRMIDMTLEHANFQRQFGAIVLGIQRRARVVRRRLGRVRLKAGDVFLIAGRRNLIDSLRDNSDFIILSGSKRDLPVPGKAPIAAGIFISTIALAALGIVSIPAAAITGAVLMIATGCLNIRQATRAIDRKIYLLVGSMLALGTALQASGGAQFIAEQILRVPFADSPLAMVALLFIVVAITTNVLSNNACAILFTPIALTLAGTMDIPEGLRYDIFFIFALTVVFGANCSFASPIGYQTNLLVMGPGHYRFRDFLKAGIPLIIVLWIVYIGIAKYYFGL